MTTPFVSHYLPDLFWPAELATFGTSVVYIPAANPPLQATVSVLWKEGASDEEVSPGRYSHLDVRNADLPAPPALGDLVQNSTNGKQYQVVRIEALAIGFSILVLQEAGPIL